MEKNKTPVLKIILIVLGAIAAAFISVVFLTLVIFPQTQKKYAGSIPGGPDHFYKSEIEKMIGRDLTEKAYAFNGIDCKKLFYNGEVERGFDRLEFYMFENGKTADKAFQKIDEAGNLNHEDNKVWGYGKNEAYNDTEPYDEALKDILQFEYYYIYGNLIVEYSKYYETLYSGDTTSQELASRDSVRDRVLDLIPKIFNAEGKKNYVYADGQDGYEIKEDEEIPGDSVTPGLSFAYGTSGLDIPDDNYRTYYEIFVYSFYDSDGDGTGDLKGVTEKLDYISDMGFNGIWLMPIFPSPTYHKYDATDYMAVDEQYGSMEDFDELIAEAHSRGIKIIIDLAINHTSSQHPWFKEAVKYLRSLEDGQEPDYAECPYAGYYHFERESGGNTWYNINGSDKWYYEGSFWSEMPDLDLSCEALWTELEGIADFWIDHGVDGFRMDAPLHYEENAAEFNEKALKRLYDYCASGNPDFYMVSEVWAGENVIADYYNSATPSMFNFDIAQAEGKLIRAGNGKLKAEKLVEAMVKYQEDFGANNPNYIDAPFLTNHDMPRVANALNNNPEALKRAAGLLMTMNGAPFVYYGEEIGMCSKGTKDENKRLPMIWSSTGEAEGTTRKPADADSGITSSFEGVEEQLADPDSILNYYRRAIRLRNENPELARGYITIVDELTEDNTAVIIKAWNDSAIAVVYNTSDEEIKIDLSNTGVINVKQKNGNSESMDYDFGKAALNGYLTVSPEETVILENGILTLPAGGIAVLG